MREIEAADLYSHEDSGQTPGCGTFRVARWLLPRLLGLIFLCAFWSLKVQYDGLCGDDGVAPARDALDARRHYARNSEWSDMKRFCHWPTPFFLTYHGTAAEAKNGSWQKDGDRVAHAALTAGMVLSILLVLGVFQGPLLLVLGYLYLGFTGITEPFLNFQWDILLIEAAFVTALLAPWRWWTGRIPHKPDAPRLAWWALHFVVFKLMFMSGYVKPASGDSLWVGESGKSALALTVHYETQPLPNRWSWTAHQWPEGWQVFACWVMYFIEIILPFAIFFGSWGRLAAALGFSAFMLILIFTGNYAFFNFLTLFLALALLDDRWWPNWVKRALRVPDAPPLRRPVLRWIIAPLAACHILLSLVAMSQDTIRRANLESESPQRPAWAQSVARALQDHTPEFARKWHEKVSPFGVANSYGLFADMMKERWELVIEVSADAQVWHEVPFKYKPVDPQTPPRWVAPHQPRLDWQMWFVTGLKKFDYQAFQRHAALRWLAVLAERMLRHSPAVWDLLGKPPIPVEQVRYLRFKKFRYQFTTAEERKTTGAWWKRESGELWSQEMWLPETPTRTASGSQ